MKKIKYTKEDKILMDKMAEEVVANLNRNVLKSVERDKRWEKIWKIEETKWPYRMGYKYRDEIPKKLHPILDECIAKSQQIARDACQTPELTEAYLRENACQIDKTEGIV